MSGESENLWDGFEKEDVELLLTMLSTPEFLQSEGYRVTPKGIMFLTLVGKFGIDHVEAEKISQALENGLLLSGFVTLRSNQVRMLDE